MNLTRTPAPRLFAYHFIVFILAIALRAQAQNTVTDAASRVKAETQRLQQSLKDKPITIPDFSNLNSMIGGLLTESHSALDSGRLYLALQKLGQATNRLQGARMAEEKAESVKSGLPAFESEWGKASLELTALDQKARQRNWSHAMAALQALSEAAQGKAIPLLEGGRGFASSTQPKDGLFYMGQAQGEAAFAAFVYSLDLPRKSAQFPLRSLLPELQRLQEKTNAAFQPPKSIDLHSRFIALNGTLKLAGELDASRFYAGALYVYLEATRHFGMLDAVAPDAAKQSQLKDALAAEQKRLAASRRDDSLAQLFVEVAQSQLAHADGSAPSADELRSAQVIVEQVLPAYFAVLKPAAPLQRASGKTIDITLVRWPYT